MRQNNISKGSPAERIAMVQSTIDYLAPDKTIPEEVNPETGTVEWDTWTCAHPATVELIARIPRFYNGKVVGGPPKQLRRKYTFTHGVPIRIPRVYRMALQHLDPNGRVCGGLLPFGVRQLDEGETDTPVSDDLHYALRPEDAPQGWRHPQLGSTPAKPTESAAPKSAGDMDSRLLARARARRAS